MKFINVIGVELKKSLSQDISRVLFVKKIHV